MFEGEVGTFDDTTWVWTTWSENNMFEGEVKWALPMIRPGFGRHGARTCSRVKWALSTIRSGFGRHGARTCSRMKWALSMIRPKTFPDIPCVSQKLGGPFLRLDIPRERRSIPPGSGKSGKKRRLTGNVGLSTAY